MFRRLRWLATLSSAGWVVVSVSGSASQSGPLETPRAVYITAINQAGEPVLDLAAGDLVVKENRQERAIVSVEPARAPLHVALIIDDNGTGMFRSSVAGFVQRLLPHAMFSITTVTGQPLRLVDYTRDPAKLSRAIGLLNARPATPDGGQLLAGISEAARELRRMEAQRPVIVVLTVGGEEHSTMPGREVLNQLRDSRASLNVFAVSSSLLRQMEPITRPATLLETIINIGEVLGDGPPRSGGVREDIAAVTGSVQGMHRLAGQLAYQYRVSYVLPGGVKPSDRFQVSAARPGVTIRAPTRIPR